MACLPSRKANDPKRPLTEPGRYTLLRFLDEATALAAGHRPCWSCRRPDFHRFLAAWAKGNPGYGVAGDTRVADVDAVLHRQRIDADDRKVAFSMGLDLLPDGCLIEIANADYLVLGRNLYRWSPSGYAQKIPRPVDCSVHVWTPRSVVAALLAGYVPGIHGSVGALGPCPR